MTTSPAVLGTAPQQKSRTTGWLLIASLPLFLVWFAVAMSMLASTGASDSADLTAGQLSSVRLAWVVVWPLYAVALLVGLAGASRLNRTLAPNRWATAGQVANVLSGLLIVVNAALMLSLTTADGARLGDDQRWDPAIMVSVAAIVVAHVGQVLSGVALRTTGHLRRTGLWVAIVAGLFVALNVVTAGALPPFLPAVLWLVMGIALLRRPVASTA